MNENIDLTEILKDVPAGTPLWSSVLGVCRLVKVDTDSDTTYPIKIKFSLDDVESFTKDGRLFYELPGECVLFPSRDQRDWSKFHVPQKKKVKVTLHPFDKVLVRDDESYKWFPRNFEKINIKNERFQYQVIGYFTCHKYCIPYNEETKHLTFTAKDPDKEYIIIDGLANNTGDNTGGGGSTTDPYD